MLSLAATSGSTGKTMSGPGSTNLPGKLEEEMVSAVFVLYFIFLVL